MSKKNHLYYLSKFSPMGENTTSPPKPKATPRNQEAYANMGERNF